MSAGYSPIPSRTFLEQLRDDEFRDGFVADHVRTRFALLIRSLREQRGWSQAELGRRMGKPQSVVSRLEDPDYGRLSLQTIFEVAAAFELPVYIDLPNWDEWFRLMEDMSSKNLKRENFDIDRLCQTAAARQHALVIWAAMSGQAFGPPPAPALPLAAPTAAVAVSLNDLGSSVYVPSGRRDYLAQYWHAFFPTTALPKSELSHAGDTKAVAALQAGQGRSATQTDITETAGV